MLQLLQNHVNQNQSYYLFKSEVKTSVLFKYPLNNLYTSLLAAVPEATLTILGCDVSAPKYSTLNCITKYLKELSHKENLSTKCIGKVNVSEVTSSLYLLFMPPILSELTKFSTIFLKSNIPTPALLGVVLNVAIRFVFVDGFGIDVPICTSAINFTLVSFATSLYHLKQQILFLDQQVMLLVLDFVLLLN